MPGSHLLHIDAVTTEVFRINPVINHSRPAGGNIQLENLSLDEFGYADDPVRIGQQRWISSWRLLQVHDDRDPAQLSGTNHQWGVRMDEVYDINVVSFKCLNGVVQVCCSKVTQILRRGC